jgi:hypothetical protein
MTITDDDLLNHGDINTTLILNNQLVNILSYHLYTI